jgi:hypothetical protein
MKIKSISAASLVTAGLLLTGCLGRTPIASPSETHGLKLETKSSRQVKVTGPWFHMNHGSLELAGSIARNACATTTAFSHLDVLFFDDADRILQTKPIRFSPQSVGHSRFASKRGYYSLNLDVLPAGTIRIRVEAHDTDLATAHAQSVS